MDHSPITPASASALNLIGALLEQRTGQQLAANRAYRIETALKPLMRDRNIENLDQLITAMIVARDGDLADAVVDAMLNQETSFFRDAAVLDLVADAIHGMRGEAPHNRVRVWSAGCSTGQEPLSLGMLLSERAGGQTACLPEIVATDVSPSALARAKSGRFSQFEVQRGLPVRRMIAWFDSDGTDWEAKPELVRKIQFRQQNLATDPPPPGKYDVVLCRNVMLYFSASVRRKVFDTLHAALKPGGLLVMGAGETVIGQTEKFAPCDRFRGFYRSIVPGIAEYAARSGTLAGRTPGP